jgi:hypothetical protein
LKGQIPDLKCLSLSDRDNGNFNDVAKNLSLPGMPDLNEGGGLRYRTWRRWELESYLFCKPAMVRLVMAKNPGLSEADATTRFDNAVAGIGLVYPADYKLSDKTPTNGRLFDADAKEILYPVCEALGIDKFEIAREMHDDEIFEDVKTLINEIVAMCV